MPDDSTKNSVTGGIFFNAVIQGRDLHVSLPREIIPAMTGLPPGTASFTGRDSDMAAVLSTLAPPPPPAQVPIAAIGGMGGVGKTELAIQAARTALARGWFPGGVLFADLRGYDPDPALRVDPSQALDGLLRAIGVPGEHVPPTLESRSRLLRSILAAYANKKRRVLVVVDNVSSATQAAPLLPSDGVCAAIVTSRQVLGDLDARLIDLDVLGVDEAIELLGAALKLRDPADTRVRDQRDDAAVLADRCAGLPLAVQILAAQLAASPAKPLSAMAANMDDAASRLPELVFADRAVQAVFDTSYQRLPEAQAMQFRLLSLNSGPDISTRAAAALAGLSEAEARRGLEALARAHLVEAGAVYGRWRLHDLLHLYSAYHCTTSAATDERDSALGRLLAYYLVTARAANAHLNPRVPDPASLGFPDRERALAWLDEEYANLSANTLTAEQAGHAAFARDLPRALWEFMDWRRHSDDWITLTSAALHAARTLHDRHGQADALTAFGNAVRQVRRLDEAIDACRQAVEIYHDLGDRLGEAAALTTLGNALQEARESEDAVTACQTAAEIYRDLGDRLGEGAALATLGTALQEARRLDEAVTACQAAALIYHDLGNRHLEAMALNNLGNAQQETGMFEEAVTTCRRASEIYHGLGHRHAEAMALNNLGNALQKARRFQDAVATCQAAAQIYRDLGHRYAEAMVFNNLGNALQQVGRFEDAVTACEEAANIYRDLGHRHAEAMALNNLANALQKARRFQDAVTACQAAAQIYRDLGDFRGEGMVINNLGNVQQQMGRFEEAIDAHRRAVRIDREIGDRRAEAMALDNLGNVLRHLGRLEEAARSCEQAARILRELDHVDGSDGDGDK